MPELPVIGWGVSRELTTNGFTPLGAVLGLVFVSSAGTGLITTGVFFLATSAFDFSKVQNFGLALVYGCVYIPIATNAGRIIRFLNRKGMSTRAILGSVLLLLMVACSMPLLMTGISRSAGIASIWMLTAAYGVLCGIHWPVVQAYICSGRSGAQLRRAIGRFNITWSSATVLVFWLMGPLLRQYPLELIMLIGLLHGSNTILLRWFAPDPTPKAEIEHEPHPPIYGSLLIVFRILLPTSFLVLGAVSPMLPEVMSRLSVAQVFQPMLASIWLMSRLGAFITLQRWQGWHGRWWPVLLAGSTLVAGFGLVVISPLVPAWINSLGMTGGGEGAGVVVLVAGLISFGVGAASIYAGALYYVMEVGQEHVDSGGSHEGFIGLGYALGPAMGLIASLGSLQSSASHSSFEALILGLVLMAVVVAAVVAMILIRRQ